jgi:hypothetical protein
MRPIKTLTPVDLAIRGLFLAAIAIGGFVGRSQQTNAATESAAAPGQVAMSSMIGGGLAPGSVCPSVGAVPAAPASSSPGAGDYVLHGMVRSRTGCAPIKDAKIEFWPSDAQAGDSGGRHAVLQTDAGGAYRLHCNVPGRGTAGEEYIYLRVSAAGYAPSVTRYQLKQGQAEDSLDIVLEPEE